MTRLALLALLLIPALAASPQTTAAQTLKAAGDLDRTGDHSGSRRLLEQAIAAAVREHDAATEAEGRYILGSALNQMAQYAASDDQEKQAQALFDGLGNRHRVAQIDTVLGSNAYGSGRSEESRQDYQKALALFEALEDWTAVAKTHLSLVFVAPPAERLDHIHSGLDIARRVGDRKTEAGLLHAWADQAYASDDFDVAFERLNQARAILEEVGERYDLARVLTSIGRLYRVHGHPDQAFLFYQRARDLQKETGDIPGMIQSLNAMGIALNHLGKSSEALRYDQEALQLARGTGSPLLLKFILEAVAATQIDLEQLQQAAATLEEARKIPISRIETLLLLSEVRFGLGQYPAALETADESVALKDSRGEVARNALTNRARALWKLGRVQEALGDLRQATESVEQARARLVPTDFMKQGFADTDRQLASLSVQILLDGGQEGEALEAAERARSRAFLDLLATKDLSANRLPAQERLATPPVRSGASAGPHTTLSSWGSAPPASAEDAAALARRLNSTVLAYWVDDYSTIVWAVSPQGRISHARSDYGARTLEKWIGEALHSAGGTVSSGTVSIDSRSGGTLVAGGVQRTAWRRLYDALIRPVRQSLPVVAGSRLTIIPSGPLFRLSFAALMDEQGRYLIESFAVNYAPAMEVFEYTLLARQRTAALPARWLLVANPSGMPSSGGKELPPLPGTEDEIRNVSRFAPSGSAVLMQGKQADKASIRAAMPTATVIHLATHGILDTNNPLASFLALGRIPGQPASSGRLTAEEVYSLDLHADLVVLSACRTGLGQISGDGVAGLARAFFYAGAASVVATLWDVPDQPTSQLMDVLYQSLDKGAKDGKAGALRDAQLHLLRSLRKGQVVATTPFGKLALPEDPVFWAGYVLIGEP
ncbi:MAG TPA: CHAT domain-containing protein [Verrucomicrobiae bacterium]|nr:CHAT domain-containing protein [Verrucomicrobiae bacterium]